MITGAFRRKTTTKVRIVTFLAGTRENPIFALFVELVRSFCLCSLSACVYLAWGTGNLVPSEHSLPPSLPSSQIGGIRGREGGRLPPSLPPSPQEGREEGIRGISPPLNTISTPLPGSHEGMQGRNDGIRKSKDTSNFLVQCVCE